MRPTTRNSDLALLNDEELAFHTRESNPNFDSFLKIYWGVSDLTHTREHLYVSVSFTDERTYVY